MGFPPLNGMNLRGVEKRDVVHMVIHTVIHNKRPATGALVDKRGGGPMWGAGAVRVVPVGQ